MRPGIILLREGTDTSQVRYCRRLYVSFALRYTDFELIAVLTFFHSIAWPLLFCFVAYDRARHNSLATSMHVRE
jgi:hypothetical protein